MPWLENEVDKNLNRYRVACLILDSELCFLTFPTITVKNNKVFSGILCTVKEFEKIHFFA